MEAIFIGLATFMEGALGTGWFGAGAIFSFYHILPAATSTASGQPLALSRFGPSSEFITNFVTQPDLLIKMLNIIGLGSIGTSAIYHYRLYC